MKGSRVKIVLVLLTFHTCLTSVGQELLLMINEDFKNKSFQYFDEDTYSVVPGDLLWTREWGSGFQYADTIADMDGSGVKPWRYAITEDGLYNLIRWDNFQTNDNGMTIEANYHGDWNGAKRVSSAVMIYPWTFRRGFFEVRAKLPEGSGIMSSFFLHGTRQPIGFGCEDEYILTECINGQAVEVEYDRNGEDINFQEFDVWETNGHWIDRLRNNIHYSGFLESPTPQCQNSAGEDVCDERCQNEYFGINGETELDFANEYHTFGMYWDQSMAIFLIDGFVYRYWVDPTPIIKGNKVPETLKYVDAMFAYIGIGYGTQEDDKIKGYPKKNGVLNPPGDPFANNVTEYNLWGPHPDNIPSSQLDIEYFRYWTFLPCEDQPPIETYFISNHPHEFTNEYVTDNVITNYNKVNYGHIESGRYITISNSSITPVFDCAGNQLPFAQSKQLNLIASKEVRILPGVHMKAPEDNLPLPHTFRASIQTCEDLPDFQVMPTVVGTTFLGDNFVSNFTYEMPGLINFAYPLGTGSNGSPFKNQGVDSPFDNDDNINNSNIKVADEDFAFEIFPNPSYSEININYPFELNGYSAMVVVKDALGNIVSEFQIEDNFVLDMGNFESGVYFFNINCNKKNQIHRIIIL